MKQLTIIAFFFLSCLAMDAQVTPLDYSNAGNWSAHPMKLFDLDIKPSYTLIGADTTQKTTVNFTYPPVDAPADVFAVSPTTLIQSNGAPGTIPLDFVQKSAINFAVQLNFSYLGQLGRIYAPYYRQANLPVFSQPLSAQAQQAAIFDTAATDVLAAFKYYIDHNYSGRRVILTGHSQGALILAMMLRRMEANPAVYGQYLEKIFLSVLTGMEGGAYVSVSELKEGWLQSIPICSDATDTACLMSWQTVKEGLPFISNIPIGNNIPYNAAMVSKNLKYSAFSTTIHRQWGDSMGFETIAKPVERAIFPRIYVATGASGVTTDWVAYESMYAARVVHPTAAAWAISIAKTSAPGDQRHDPIKDVFIADLHLYDTYILAGDALRLIRQKLQGVSKAPMGPGGKPRLELYPNPAGDWLTVNGEAPPVYVVVYNLAGQPLLQQSVGYLPYQLGLTQLPAGIYLLKMMDQSGAVSMATFVRQP